MARTPFALLVDEEPLALQAEIRGDRVRVDPGSLEAALGWRLEPEGLCQGDVCIPLQRLADRVNAGGIDLVAFAELIGRPLALDAGERAAALGTAARDRGARLAALEAPDFTLPDLRGHLHSLSEQRGKKVLLVAYASW